MANNNDDIEEIEEIEVETDYNGGDDGDDNGGDDGDDNGGDDGDDNGGDDGDDNGGDDGDDNGGDDGDDNGNETKFKSLSVDLFYDIIMQFVKKGYLHSETDANMVGDILFGKFFYRISFFYKYDGKSIEEVKELLKGESTIEELQELDKLVAKRTLDYMWNNPKYFDIDISFGTILREVLDNMGAFNYKNFEYTIKEGITNQSMNCFYDIDNGTMTMFFKDEFHKVYGELYLIFGNDKNLTNFVSLYSDNKELDRLWKILYCIKSPTLQFRENKDEWSKHINYPEFNEFISKKYLQQLELFTNAVI